jgi:anti-sigma regulatory factor (Ser/Thr protein kinase)
VAAGWSHTHTWNASATNVADARDFVALRLAEHGLDSTVPDARLVVSELATNAIRHAGTRFTLTVLVQHGSVLLTVTDPSETWPALAADPLLAADMSLADGAGVVDGVGVVNGVAAVAGVGLAEGGRGLGIVAALSSSWGVTPEPHGGKSVWAVITTPDHPDGLGHGDEPGRRGRGPATPAPPPL